MTSITIEPQVGGYVLSRSGINMLTPAKLPLLLPTKPLAEALVSEWRGKEKYSSDKMKLTAMAYTAIDRIEPQRSEVVEALLVFLDTDTLSYRSEEQAALLAKQQQQWDPVLAWMQERFGVAVNVTSGVMPIEQPAALHDAVRSYLLTQDSMVLAALSMLASTFSSLILAVAVVARHLNAGDAFALSRLEEESQAEAWGRDEEADKRALRLAEESLAAANFLNLLDESGIRH